MEDILINVDSRYRDLGKYPNECKFSLTLDKVYKNIVSARIVSNEINNYIQFIDSSKNNNYIKIHIPNKINDPDGYLLTLPDGISLSIESIKEEIDKLLDNLNINLNLENLGEKYFYIFYLNESLTLTFDFNSTLGNKLVISEGWHSLYGINLQINNYIKTKYNERLNYKNQNPLTASIDLDNGKFKLSSFSLKIFDRRLRNIILGEPTINDCIRIDNFIPQGNDGLGSYTGNLNQNLNLLKNNLYKFYINDITTFRISNMIPIIDMGILDLLVNNEYEIPLGYINGGNKLLSKSKYYLNNNSNDPNEESKQINNLILELNNVKTRVSFKNDIINMYYFNVGLNIWDNNSIINKLLNKQYLRNEFFITNTQFLNNGFRPSILKDITTFEINFLNNNINNLLINGIFDNKGNSYKALGYYLGFRPLNNNFLLKSKYDNGELKIMGDKPFNLYGDDYVFVKINNWGYIDLFNEKYLGKMLSRVPLRNIRLDDYVNKEFKIRQPVNVQKIDIELVDYLGNTVNMNGSDYSFTLELKQLQVSDQKDTYERNNLIFQNYPNKLYN